MGDNDQIKGRCCARCRNHNVRCTLRGHKPYCPFINCECSDCKLTKCRQTVMAADVKIRRRVPPPTTQGIALPGHTPTPASVPAAVLLPRSEAEDLGVISAMILKYCNNDTHKALQHAEKAYLELLKIGRPLESSIMETPLNKNVPAEHRVNGRKTAQMSRDSRGLEDDPPDDRRAPSVTEQEQLRHSSRSERDNLTVPSTTYISEASNLTAKSSLTHFDDLKPKIGTTEQKLCMLPVVPKPVYADALPATTTQSSEKSPEAEADRRLFSSFNGIGTGDLRPANTRYLDVPLSANAKSGLMPASPTYHKSLNSHSNMAILEQSRALNALPLDASKGYSLISLHNLLNSVDASTNPLGSPPHVSTAPTLLSSTFLNPLSYPSSKTSTPTPAKFYVHTTEGRTLELLGCRSPLDNQSRMTFIPPNTGSVQQAAMDEDQTAPIIEKAKSHLLLGGNMMSKDSLRFQHLMPAPHQDNYSVWRPY